MGNGMSSSNQTPRSDPQREVLRCIRDFTKEHHYAPTISEICQICGFRSKGTVAVHLRTLRGLGLVTWQPGQERTLVITDGAWFAEQVFEAFLDSRGLSADSQRPQRYRMRSVLIRPEVKTAIQDAMNSASYRPYDAFSIASAYANGAVETVRFANGKHVKIKQSPKKQLAALNVYFEATGLSNGSYRSLE
jgi:SOS-response transcriptional repressor LexA